MPRSIYPQRAVAIVICNGAFTAILALAAAAAPTHGSQPVAYERSVLPLFRARCLGCHGAGLPAAGLDVRSRGDLVEGGHSGPGLIPGSPEKSLLYQLLADGRMPKGGRRFTPLELKTVADWIRAGAPGAPGGGHWAFRPPVEAAVPRVKAADRVRNPIDAFLLRDLERQGLTFAPPADPRTLIRRVTYDLAGLPPTPEEVDAFVRDCAAGQGIHRGDAETQRIPENKLPAHGRERGRSSAILRQASPSNRTTTHTPTPPYTHTFPQRADPTVSEKAYERLVDRLLASPQYGERWARYWLDTAGYADSEGVLQEDRVRPNAWRYRDYVIRAFNQDKPYDQFVREQLAGDEMVDYRRAKSFAPEVVDAITATGFLRTAVDATRDDFNPHQYGEYQYRMLHDTETIVATTVLGLPLQCARCHDHKYEPLSQKDYYRVQALFMGAVRPRGTLLPTNRRQIIAATAEERDRAEAISQAVTKAVTALTAEQAALVKEFQQRARSAEQLSVLARNEALPGPEELSKAFPEFKARLQELAKRRAAEEARRIVLPEIRAFYDQDSTPPPTPLLLRGEWLKPGDPVEPGVPTILDPERAFRISAPDPTAGTTGRRKAFAEWLTRPDHPLTSRVLVNRVWAHHFGAGIVPTVENLGRSGARPTNRGLLDWLARAFVRTPASLPERVGERENGGEGDASGRKVSHSPTPHFSHSGAKEVAASEGLRWSLKKLHRLIVLSSAYRQAGPSATARTHPPTPPHSHTPPVEAATPALLQHFPQRRLEAEAIRDGMLAVAGNLDPKQFGEPVGLEARPSGEIVTAGETGRGRRSIYLLVRRTQPVNLLNVFDAPVMETNCTRRITSTTASQALTLMNSTFIETQARQFAKRLLAESAASSDARIDTAFRRAFSRPPSAAEMASAQRFLTEQGERYRTQGKKDAEEAALADFCQALLSANEFVYVD